MNTPSYTAIPVEKPQYFSATGEHYHKKVIKSQAKVLYTDGALIAGLKTRDIVVIKYIYKHYFQQIKLLVTSNSGSVMDAEDVFQDALVILYQKISAEDLKLSSSFNTYLYSICKHLWLQRLNRREFSYEYKESSELDKWHYSSNMEEISEDFEKYKLFQQHFLELSEKDQKVLKLFMGKISLKEIASIMGYKSDKYAKVRKYICKEKLKNSILKDPRYKKIAQGYGSILAFD